MIYASRDAGFCVPENPAMLISFSDLQMVNISLRVLARPDQALLPSMYRQLGQDFDERVLPSICNEVSQIIMANANLTYSMTLIGSLIIQSGIIQASMRLSS